MSSSSLSIHYQAEQTRKNHRRQFRRLLLLTASSFVSDVTLSSATSSSSSSSSYSSPESRTTTTSQQNLHRPIMLHNSKQQLQRKLGAINPNLVNYTPPNQSTPLAYTQDELSKISQQTYGAPHTWVQCPTTNGYAGYLASYDCKAYIFCKNGQIIFS